MPPYRNDLALPPLTRLLKTELVDLASDFHLADDGTVANLRLRIRNHLVANPALLMKQKYTDLLPNYKPPDSPPPSYKTLPSQTNLDVPKSGELLFYRPTPEIPSRLSSYPQRPLLITVRVSRRAQAYSAFSHIFTMHLSLCQRASEPHCLCA